MPRCARRSWESLRKLHDELGISIIYITHDLATAYQVSDNILVHVSRGRRGGGRCRARRARAVHPYTQLLIGSIPRVSTERDWLAKPVPPSVGADDGDGCRFAARCPSVMALCGPSPPPLYRTEPRRAVACHLYRDAPIVPPEAMVSVFAEGT